MNDQNTRLLPVHAFTHTGPFQSLLFLERINPCNERPRNQPLSQG